MRADGFIYTHSNGRIGGIPVMLWQDLRGRPSIYTSTSPPQGHIGRSPTRYFVLYVGMGYLALRSKQHEKGERFIKQALALAAEVGIAEHEKQLNRIDGLGRTARRQGAYDEALYLFQTAYEGYALIRGHRHSDTLDCMAECADLAIELNRYEEGERLLRRVLSDTEMIDGVHHKRAVDCIAKLGHVSRMQGSYDEAVDLYQKAYDGYFATLGVDDENTVDCHNLLIALRRFVERRAEFLRSSEQASILFNRALADTTTPAESIARPKQSIHRSRHSHSYEVGSRHR